MMLARTPAFVFMAKLGISNCQVFKENLLSVIDTLKLGYADPVRRLSGVFDALARNRDADVGELLWGQLKP